MFCEKCGALMYPESEFIVCRKCGNKKKKEGILFLYFNIEFAQIEEIEIEIL